MQKMYSLYQSVVYTDIEKVEKIISTKKLIHLLQAQLVVAHMIYKKYSAGIHNLPPINIRDLLEFKNKENLSI